MDINFRIYACSKRAKPRVIAYISAKDIVSAINKILGEAELKEGWRICKVEETED